MPTCRSRISATSDARRWACSSKTDRQGGGMSAYIAILAAVMRRLDRWLLLRAPMLWRAQPPRSLVLASLAVIVAAIALMPTNIKVPAELDGLASYTVSIRTLLRYGVASTLFVWFQSIVGKPVGEL